MKLRLRIGTSTTCSLVESYRDVRTVRFQLWGLCGYFHCFACATDLELQIYAGPRICGHDDILQFTDLET